MFYLALSFSKLTSSEKVATLVLFFVIVFMFIIWFHIQIEEDDKEEGRNKKEEEKRRRELEKELREERNREYLESKDGLRSLILKKEQEIKYHEDLMDYLGKNSEAARLRKENIIAVLYKELKELYSKLGKLN